MIGAIASLTVSVLGILGASLHRTGDPAFEMLIASTSLVTAAVLWATGWLYDYEHDPFGPIKKRSLGTPGIGTLAAILATASLVFTALLVVFSRSLSKLGPGSPFVIAVITVVIICVLGWLNWRGIQESANVSAVAAIAALVSDLFILALIAIHVPLGTIGDIFRAVFSGHSLNGLTVLTGFAGAFLAFSGLESISQLSPVMRVPRNKTVTAALTLVFITVGVTSPLLTLFSTVLLTDPQFHHLLVHPAFGVQVDPNSFISELAGAFGGPLLSVATAVTAAALLIFACNTAIIGAYHVFVALSRMRFFPRVIELTDEFGTPFISIILAMGIPILVLLFAQGSVVLLGDLYAFGLLGAFSLTCLSLDVIRTRERRGGPHVGAAIDPELLGVSGFVNAPTATQPTVIHRLAYALVPEPVFAALRRILARLTAWAQSIAARLNVPAHTVGYYIGFLTTLLVMVAWMTNLVFKPLATIFGGGLTLLGLAVAVANYQYLQRRGVAPAYLSLPSPMPNSWLVLLSPDVQTSRKVVESVVRSAQSHPLAFLYLTPTLPDTNPPRLFEIRDRYGRDKTAQDVLSFAKRVSRRANVSAKFLFAVGGAKQVFDIAHRIRPDEIVAQKDLAKRVTHALPAERGMAISPEYVRFQSFDGVTVAHNVLHHLYAAAAADTSAHDSVPEHHALARAARSLRQRLVSLMARIKSLLGRGERAQSPQARTESEPRPAKAPRRRSAQDLRRRSAHPRLLAKGKPRQGDKTRPQAPPSYRLRARRSLILPSPTAPMGR